MDRALLERLFEEEALPALVDYTRIPASPPPSTPNGRPAGPPVRAAHHMGRLVREPAGRRAQRRGGVELPGRTPAS